VADRPMSERSWVLPHLSTAVDIAPGVAAGRAASAPGDRVGPTGDRAAPATGNPSIHDLQHWELRFVGPTRRVRRLRRLRRTAVGLLVLGLLTFGLVDDLQTQARLHGREVQLTATKALAVATARLAVYTEGLLRKAVAERDFDQGTFDQLSAQLASDQQQLAQAQQVLAATNSNLATLNTCVTGVQQAVGAMAGGNQQASIAAISAVATPCESLQSAGAGGPVYPFDFPDPDVIDAAGTYFAYGTNSAEGNIQIITSTDLTHWTPVGNALPRLASWARPGATWAPSVVALNGAYLLFYTADAGSRECISVATSARPQGPFVDSSSAPLMCQPTLGGSIDPAPYLDGAGRPYLTWKSNGGSGQPATIWAQPLASSGTGLAPGTSPSALIAPSQPWEGAIVEAPFMWRANGTYYLFYSGNNWDSTSYAEGVAVCAGPLGPCAKPLAHPDYASQPNLVSPGGASVFADSQGNPWIAFHAYLPSAVGYPNARLLFLRRVSFASGLPEVGAPS